MARPVFLVMLWLLLPLCALWGQEGQAAVRLIVRSGETAIVRVQCSGHNERAVLDNAKKEPLRKLLYEGLEGLSEESIVDKSIDPKQHLWLMKFLTEEAATDNYSTYIEGIELLGDIRPAATGGLEGTFHVFLRYDRLLRKAKAEGVMKKASSGTSGGGGWL